MADCGWGRRGYFPLSLILLLLASAPLFSQFREIDFSGYTWTVRSESHPSEPGPNRFDDTEESVRIDDQQRLNLSIRRRDAQWTSSEVVCRGGFGYGTYEFTVAGRPDLLDVNAVLGLFIWDQERPPHFNEIDIEFARWGAARYPYGQYTLQPYTQAGNVQTFDVPLSGDSTTHVIQWKPGTIRFSSRYTGDENRLIAFWIRAGEDVPVPGETEIHINLWLFEGRAPVSGLEQHAVIESFSYRPFYTDESAGR